ncbi:MAG TPA: hypothetical protein VJ803_06685 [Gemmatimonadaceae bacterium]|nr:hypothetical protein [Gemmatimonadaceae bacterium]
MHRGTWARVAAMTILLAGTPVDELGAQQLEQRIAGIGDGRVLFAFAARPGVCGDGYNISTGDDGCWSRTSDDGTRLRRLAAGPIRVTLTIRDQQVVSLRTVVGGDSGLREGVIDLGRVSTQEASHYLLSLAERGEGRVGGEAIVPAVLADSVTVWPRLVTLARNERLPRSTRETATLWLGFAAADVIDPGDGETTEADEPREQAVFALSQLPRDQAVPSLIQVARTHRSPAIRRRAIFWLSQRLDERGINLMEEVLKASPRRE